MTRAPRRRDVALVALLAVGLFAAPTVGDIGGCGTQATDLDESVFAEARKQLDCQRCRECGFTTTTCKNACNPAVPSDVSFPPTCRPLAHDGDVCLRALEAASCGDYAAFVDDTAPSVPSECDFCLTPAPSAPVTIPMGDH
jgi:hypothetical protein